MFRRYFFDIYCGNSGIFSPVYLGDRNIIKLRREDKFMSENGTGLELLGFLGGTAKSKEAEAQKKLDQYEYLMEKGELLTDIRFTQEIKEKGLQAYDGDVQLIMPTEESTLYKGIFGATYLLERCYNVKITRVDREERTVYLSYRAAQAEYRPAALEKIKKSIEAGEELEVKDHCGFVPGFAELHCGWIFWGVSYSGSAAVFGMDPWLCGKYQGAGGLRKDH